MAGREGGGELVADGRRELGRRRMLGSLAAGAGGDSRCGRASSITSQPFPFFRSIGRCAARSGDKQTYRPF